MQFLLSGCSTPLTILSELFLIEEGTRNEERKGVVHSLDQADQYALNSKRACRTTQSHFEPAVWKLSFLWLKVDPSPSFPQDLESCSLSHQWSFSAHYHLE